MNEFLLKLFKPIAKAVAADRREHWAKRLDSGGRITSRELKDATNNRVMLRTADTEYKIISYPAFLEYIREDDTADFVYQPEGVFDCDNFGAVFDGRIKEMGNFSCGRIHGYFTWVEGYHECNLIYTTMGYILYEPQNRKIYRFDEDMTRISEVALM